MSSQIQQDKTIRPQIFQTWSLKGLGALALFLSIVAPVFAQNSNVISEIRVIGNRRILKETVLACLYFHVGDNYDSGIDERDFNPNKHRYLTHQQARAIDSAIDQYNATIAECVRHARSEGRNWFVFDMCGVLDGLAQRRYLNDGDAARRNEWEPYPLPPELDGLDTRFFLSDRSGRLQGGLFGLDGVHPTTSGYAVLAGAVRDVLVTAGLDAKLIDYGDLLAKDTLNAGPPALMTTAFDLITPFLMRLVSRRR